MIVAVPAPGLHGMAASAPSSFQSLPPARVDLVSSASSSSSTSTTAAPAGKEVLLIAGRRRLEEYQRRKTAGKGRKASIAKSSDDPAAVSEAGTLHSTAVGDATVSGGSLASNGNKKIARNTTDAASGHGLQAARAVMLESPLLEHSGGIDSGISEARDSFDDNAEQRYDSKGAIEKVTCTNKASDRPSADRAPLHSAGNSKEESLPDSAALDSSTNRLASMAVASERRFSSGLIFSSQESLTAAKSGSLNNSEPKLTSFLNGGSSLSSNDETKLDSVTVQNLSSDKSGLNGRSPVEDNNVVVDKKSLTGSTPYRMTSSHSYLASTNPSTTLQSMPAVNNMQVVKPYRGSNSFTRPVASAVGTKEWLSSSSSSRQGLAAEASKKGKVQGAETYVNSTLRSAPESLEPTYSQEMEETLHFSRPPYSNSSTFKPLSFVPPPSQLFSSTITSLEADPSPQTLPSSNIVGSWSSSMPASVAAVMPSSLEQSPVTAEQEGTTEMEDLSQVLKPDLLKSFMPVHEVSKKDNRTDAKESHQLWPAPSGRDEFASLEQHIEDLTQEKFSLQRGLDAARLLAESLAKENSSLTEDFNNQGALVTQLKSELESLQGQVQAQAVMVATMKAERDKAHLDSSAAVERSQAFAAEVIALEEKVLRSRSNELKLDRDLKSLTSDVESQKKQLSSLEKDRANLRSVIDALQEEKKLLQGRILKSSIAEDARSAVREVPMVGSVDATKVDASTSTADFESQPFIIVGEEGRSSLHYETHVSQDHSLHLDQQHLEQQHRQPMFLPVLPSRPLPSPSRSMQPSVSSSEHFATREMDSGFHSPAYPSIGDHSFSLASESSILPPEQKGTIDNINALITELSEEKQALLRALRAESVGAAELRALNSELYHKLEIQTQRLELAVAQTMAHGSSSMVESLYGPPPPRPQYADEGDEVVDRVLGWIMQLFHSGASRRKRL